MCVLIIHNNLSSTHPYEEPLYAVYKLEDF
jgi:hypothetical protein